MDKVEVIELQFIDSGEWHTAFLEDTGGVAAFRASNIHIFTNSCKLREQATFRNSRSRNHTYSIGMAGYI